MQRKLIIEEFTLMMKLNPVYWKNCRALCKTNRTKIKTNRMLKETVLTLPDYLISKGSVNGYLLREEIF
jgi:hypothetical protein